MQRIRATAIVVRENKLLMIHRFKNGEEYYVLPGGSVEDGETAEAATVRELEEETSLKARVVSKEGDFIENEILHSLYFCEAEDGEVKIKEDSIEAQIADENNVFMPLWVDIEALPDLVIYPGFTKDFLLSYFKLSV
jgi:8-oxo-dGTP diphosphatase